MKVGRLQATSQTAIHPRAPRTNAAHGALLFPLQLVAQGLNAMWSARTDEQWKEVEKIYRANQKAAKRGDDTKNEGSTKGRAVVFRHFSVTHPGGTEYRCTVPGCDHHRPSAEEKSWDYGTGTRVSKR